MLPRVVVDEADRPRLLRVRLDEDRRDDVLPARPDAALRPLVDFFAVFREADFLADPFADVLRAEPPDDLPRVDFFAALFRAPPLCERELFADFLVAIGTSLLALSDARAEVTGCAEKIKGCIA